MDEDIRKASTETVAIMRQQLEDAAKSYAENLRQAADAAYRGQLAFVTGNGKAYMKALAQAASERLNEAYDELDGPRAQTAAEEKPAKPSDS